MPDQVSLVGPLGTAGPRVSDLGELLIQVVYKAKDLGRDAGRGRRREEEGVTKLTKTRFTIGKMKTLLLLLLLLLL